MDKKKLREQILKARLYRLFAFMFAGIGLILFIFMYFQNIEGNLLQAFQNPLNIGIFVIPFLPAFVLSLRASSLEKKVFDVLEGKKEKK